MSALSASLLGLRYDPKEIHIELKDDGTADLWRHDGEAQSEVYMGLSCEWLSRGTNELGEEAVIWHDDKRTALQFAILLITDYHPHWRTMGLLMPKETAPPIIGRSNQGVAGRYQQRNS